MSTRSNIIIKRNNGKVESVYCHSDGYLSYNGNILLNNYKDIDKINMLLDYGNISFLREEIEDINFYENEYKNIWKDLNEYLEQVDKLFIEYIYMYDEQLNKWFYTNKTYDYYKNKDKMSITDFEELTQEKIDKE